MPNIYRAGLLVAVLSAASSFTPSLAAPSNAGASRPAPVTLTEKDGGKVAIVKIGTKIELRLPSNASTGYSWVLDQGDAKKLPSMGKASYEQGKAEVPGAPGIQVWHFKAAKKGVVTLKLNYLRPWEKNTPPAKTWKVTIRINRI
jgi:inhibitor of cysteine peptidase